MSDLISRQAAIDALETVGYDFSESELSEVELEEVCGAVGDVRQDMIGRIKRLPSAQPKRGKWILDRSGAYCCSKCMEPCAGYVMMKPRDKFCKMCGSRNEVTE